jgi:Ca2+-binding RTX toxin-like protein
MATTNGTASSETLTRKIADDIIFGLAGDDGSGSLDSGDGHDNLDGSFGTDTRISGAGNDTLNDGEVAGQRDITAAPLFNFFRPF